MFIAPSSSPLLPQIEPRRQTRKFVDAFRPGVENIVLVAGGDNDMGHGGTQVETAEANYEDWALMMRAMGWKTIVSTTPARTFNKDYPDYESDRQKFNAWLRTNCKSFADGLYDVDVITTLADTKNPKYYRLDGVHLTPAGYELTADEIAKVIQAVAKGDKK